MKKLILSLFTLTALSFSALGGQNEKFTGTTQIQAGTLSLKPGTTLTLANTSSAPQITRSFLLGTPETGVTSALVASANMKTTAYTLKALTDTSTLASGVVKFACVFSGPISIPFVPIKPVDLPANLRI